MCAFVYMCVNDIEQQIKWTQPLNLKYIHLRIWAANAFNRLLISTNTNIYLSFHSFFPFGFFFIHFRLHSKMRIKNASNWPIQKKNARKKKKKRQRRDTRTVCTSSHSNNDKTLLIPKWNKCLPFDVVAVFRFYWTSSNNNNDMVTV